MMVELVLWSAVAPLALALLSSLWRYPAVLEEVVKWAVLKYGSGEQVLKSKAGTVVGLSFGISESVLYAMGAWSGAQWDSMLLRLALTVPMHMLTGTMIAAGMERRIGWIGLISAMIVHALFNYLAR